MTFGGNWVDKEVIRDRNWVSSRQPGDIPAFNREMLKLFAESYTRSRKAACKSIDQHTDTEGTEKGKIKSLCLCASVVRFSRKHIPSSRISARTGRNCRPRFWRN